MSMVARTNPGPAEDDITDTDDGIPDFSGCILAGYCAADCVWRYDCRAVTTSRLLHSHRGVAHVTRELEAGSRNSRRWPSDAGRCSGTRN
ncbi:hypothetical protein ECP03047772_4836 [Escherichia coli P0304777.2]|nr:hypothetical protein ECP03047772_4836 [Escherichia coli P0304777.2]ENE98201.1 hypothetical protein ECP03047778_5235 [Escherichia coli P0304777.8]